MDTSGSGRRRHRSWPETLKREIVAASFEPGSSVSLVARRYDLTTNQLFSWRKLYRDGLLAGLGLVPVAVAAGAGRDCVWAVVWVATCVGVGRGVEWVYLCMV